MDLKVYNKNNVVINENDYIKLYSYNQLVAKFDKDFRIVLLNTNRNTSITTEKYIDRFLNDFNLLDYKIIE